MSSTFPLLVLILGAATAFSYSPNHGGLMRVMKKSTSQNPEASAGAGYPLNDVIIKYLKRRPAMNPSCWIQYNRKCPRSSWISRSQAEASAAVRDSRQPVMKHLGAKLGLLKHILLE